MTEKDSIFHYSSTEKLLFFVSHYLTKNNNIVFYLAIFCRRIAASYFSFFGQKNQIFLFLFVFLLFCRYCLYFVVKQKLVVISYQYFDRTLFHILLLIPNFVIQFSSRRHRMSRD